MIRTARGQSERGGPVFGCDRSLEDAKRPAYSVEPIKHLSSSGLAPRTLNAGAAAGFALDRERGNAEVRESVVGLLCHIAVGVGGLPVISVTETLSTRAPLIVRSEIPWAAL
jgi:hypothetical protein